MSSILRSNGPMGTRSKPTFVLLGHSLLSNNMFVYPCLASLASFSFSALSFYLFLCLSRSRPCHTLCPPWACACRSLRPLACVVASVPLVDCLDVTTYEIHLCGVSLLDKYPFCTPCDVDMLVLLDLCHLFGFLYFFASLHTCLHVHA